MDWTMLGFYNQRGRSAAGSKVSGATSLVYGQLLWYHHQSFINYKCCIRSCPGSNSKTDTWLSLLQYRRPGGS
jgi:hypothetical protein